MFWKSSSTNLTISLELAQRYLYRYGGPFFTIFGIINCLFSLLVFTRKNLRKSTCSIYFIAFNIANFLFIIFSLLSFTLEIGYNYDPALHYLSYCRFRLYLGYLFNCLCPLYLLFASIDRVLITSHNVQMRQRSTHHLAYKIIAINTLIWILIQIHVIFFTNILQIKSNYFYCYIESGWYFVSISYISLIKEILIPSLLALFGFWSLKNIHRVRVTPFILSNNNRLSVIHSRDRQFVRMLLIDIITYILFNFTMTSSLMYEQITQYQEKTIEQIEIVLLIRNVAIFSVHIPFCINFYTYLLVSKTFRKEVKNAILWK